MKSVHILFLRLHDVLNKRQNRPQVGNGAIKGTNDHPKRFRAWAHQTLIIDLRYGVRMLNKNPTFTVAALFTLALGIGVNTAIFSATYGVLLKPLPYLDPSRLVEVTASRTLPTSFHTKYVSTAEFEEISSQNGVFEQLADYSPASFTLTGSGEPESLVGMQVSGDFFSVYGVRPILGRPILPADTQPGHNEVAVLSYALWQQHFGGDPAIAGKVIRVVVQPANWILNHALDAKPYTVVGVMPPHAHFPLTGDLWVPLVQGRNVQQTDMMGHSLRIVRSVAAVARLKSNVTLDQAKSQLHTIASRLAAEYPATDKGWDLGAVLLRDEVVGGYQAGFLLLLGAVTFVLLLACVSVSSLLIARGWARRTEIAVRESLGATRWRLVRQFLVESLVLALAGGTLSLILAFWSADLLRAIAPPETPRLDEVGLNWHVLVYTLAVSLFAGILCGLAPALHMTNRELSGSLKEGTSGTFASIFSRSPHRVRNFLVIAEIALAFLLVVGATLALRSFEKLVHVNLGYKPDHILTMYIKFSSSVCAKPEQCNVTIREVLERVRALPGVQSAAIAGTRPLGLAFTIGNLQIQGKPHSEARVRSTTEFGIVTPGYFRTMGVPLISGRTFTDSDNQKSISVAIVNDAMGQGDFSGNPVGKRFGFGGADAPNWIEVVGEVGNARDMHLSRSPVPEFYLAFSQANLVPKTCLLVRTAFDPMSIASAVRHQIWSVDAGAPISELETMDQAMSRDITDPRFRTVLLSAFGGLGLLLALIGVYGVISYSVGQRTREIGIRMAFGAQPGDVLRLVMSEGMLLSFSGIVIGIAAAIALTRFMRGLLFEVTATDPLTFIGAAVTIMAATLLACYIPARSAMRVDPVDALRHE